MEQATPYRGHMPTLDGLRGLAIAIVIAFHYYLYDHHFAPAHALYLLTRAGWLGVDLFFVLSGFLITGILLDQKERGTEGYFKTFYIRRTLRIFPLYYGVLFLVFGLLRFTPAFDEPSFRALEHEQWGLWLYAVNWVNWHRGTLVFVSDSFEANHFWSLASEEQFYMVWPALVRFVPRRAFTWLSVALIVLSFGAKAVFAPSEEALMLFRMDGLVVGALLATLVRDPQYRAWVERAATPVLLACALTLGALFVWRGGLLHNDVWMARAGCSIAAIGAGAAVIAAVQVPRESPAAKLLCLKPLAFLGRYSYGIYVFHWAFHPLFERYVFTMIPREPTGVALVDGLFVVALKTAAAVLVAVASFHLFEARFLALKDRWAKSK